MTAGIVVLSAVLAAASTTGITVAVLALLVSVFVFALAALGRRRVGFLAIAGGFATAPVYRGVEAITSETGTPTDLLLLLGLVLLVPEMLVRKSGLSAAYFIAFGFVVALGLRSTAVSEEPLGSLALLLQWGFYLGVLPIAMSLLRPNLRTIKGFLWCYLVGHGVSTLVALAEGPPANNRYDGLTHHANAFANAGAVSVAIVLFLFHEHKRVRDRIVLAGFAGAGLLAVQLSGSRGAALVVAVLILLVPIVERSAISGFVLAGFGALGVALLPYIAAVSGEESSIGRLLGSGTANYTNNLREGALEDGVERFYGSPILGTGLDGIGIIHNVYLEIAVAIGLVGLAAMLVLVYLLARPLFSDHRLRRLGYLTWAWIVVAPAVPSLVDRGTWLPLCVAVLATLRPWDGDEDQGLEPGGGVGTDRPSAGQLGRPVARPLARGSGS